MAATNRASGAAAVGVLVWTRRIEALFAVLLWAGGAAVAMGGGLEPSAVVQASVAVRAARAGVWLAAGGWLARVVWTPGAPWLARVALPVAVLAADVAAVVWTATAALSDGFRPGERVFGLGFAALRILGLVGWGQVALTGLVALAGAAPWPRRTWSVAVILLASGLLAVTRLG